MTFIVSASPPCGRAVSPVHTLRGHSGGGDGGGNHRLMMSLGIASFEINARTAFSLFLSIRILDMAASTEAMDEQNTGRR